MRPVLVKWSIECLNNGHFDLRLYSEKYPICSWDHYPSITEINIELSMRFEI